MTSQFSPLISTGIAGCRRYVLAVAGFSFFANVLTLALPLYTVQLYDRVLVSGSGATLTVITFAAVAALAAAALIEDIRSRLLVFIGCRFDRALSADLVARDVEKAARSGQASGQTLRDLDTVRTLLTGSGTLALLDLIWTPIFVAVVFLLHPLLGLIVGIGAVAIAVMAAVNQLAVARPLADALASGERSYRFTDMILRHAEVVQGMGMLPDLMRHWGGLRASALERQATASAANSTLSSVIKLLRYGLQIAIFAAGAWLVVGRELSGGALFASSLLATRALMPVDQIAAIWRQLAAGREALSRLEQVIASPARPSAMKLPAATGALSLERVTYTPAGLKLPVVNGVSFALQPGEAIGIVGPSAAGKSTLARLIVGAIRPDDGVVRLDGADSYSWERGQFGRMVGYLPQGIELFDGTIKDNIARFREADSAEIVAAARLAGVHDMILALPNGYETELGATGLVLSGGQRQRIALARAVFGNPCLVVLDEPTSNLDAEGETALRNVIASLKARRASVLLIAHRPAILLSLDKLLVMTEGRVAGFGGTQQIMPQIAPGYMAQARPMAVPA